MARHAYIRHRFAKPATYLALFSTLLAFSPFSFSQNLVTNPGFENGTSGWTLDEDASAQFTESSGRSGDRLTHYSSSSSYKAETTQTVSGLSAGTYRFSVYTVGGATSGAWLWAYCDGQTFATTIPSAAWGNWTQVTVDNISVSGGGSCKLGITTEDSEWSSFDDVVFEQVSGSGGDNDITVRARGTSGTESVSLQVGGTTVETWTLSTSMQNYEATTEEDGDVRVAFTNDADGRDVQVDYVDVNGDVRQAEDQAENTGLWDGECGGGSHSEWMHCNGYISFGTVSGDSDPPPDNGDIFLPDYIIGADVTWVLEHEYIGRTFSDNGQTQPLETILSNHGFNYIRIRTFVCPGCPGGYAHNNYSGAPADEDWADTAHTIEWAKRVKAEEMGIFLDFHLSDLWASIGEQHRPSAWEGMSVSQMSTASYNYAKGVLDQMVAEGVKPDMVQCGNENNTHLSGFSFNDWAGFSGIMNSCFQAVRDTDPDIITVAHHGRPRPDGDFASWVDRLFVWENPTIDADAICGSTYGTTNNGDDWEDMFNYAIDTTGKPVFSCEYSDNRRELVNNTFRFDLPNGMGWGAFLWEPHAFGDRRIFWLDGSVYRTTESMDEYARIAQEEGLPVPHQR